MDQWGSGAGIARQLAADGARVIVNYRVQTEAVQIKVVADVAAGGRAVAVAADVTNPSEVEALVAQPLATSGRLDIVVNNAGIYRFAGLKMVRKHSIAGSLTSMFSARCCWLAPPPASG